MPKVISQTVESQTPIRCAGQDSWFMAPSWTLSSSHSSKKIGCHSLLKVWVLEFAHMDSSLLQPIWTGCSCVDLALDCDHKLEQKASHRRKTLICSSVPLCFFSRNRILQICRWYHPYGIKLRGTKKPLDESESREWKSWLKDIQKMKIMASGSITPWEIDGETVETVSNYFFELQNHFRWWLQPWN